MMNMSFNRCRLLPSMQLLLLVTLFALAACHDMEGLDESQFVRDGDLVFVNTAKEVKYVGSKACRPCHEEIYDAYMRSPTGKSMSVMDSSNVIEQFPQQQAVYDSTRDFYYEMVQKDGKYFQREYRLGSAGNVIHERMMQAQYVIGSGTNLRMYFYDENGTFYQLPLTWYVHKQRWDMSPGYSEFVNVRFSRYVTPMCMSCHNGYMQLRPDSHSRYEQPYKIGVGCEDCHGPGDLHVREFEGEKLGFPSKKYITIVNSPRLSPQRQVDICQACHLEGVARALQDEQTWHDFRPGMLLSEHRSIYSPAQPRKQAFRVANTAYRLLKSRCFNSSHAGMTCTTCHDSHGMLRTSKVEFNRQNCQKCHPPDSLPGEESSFPHSPTDDCIPCHMKQTGTENTLHGVVNTDHWIRVDAKQDVIDWTELKHESEERPPFRLVADVDANDEESEIRKGIAYAEMYWGEHETRRVYLDSAFKYISNFLSRGDSTARALFYTGRLYYEFEQYENARAALQQAIDTKPAYADAYYRLGETFERLQRPEQAIAAFSKAAQLLPGEPAFHEALGLALARIDSTDEALAALKRALEIDSLNPLVHYVLGNLYVFDLKQPEAALQHFQQVVSLDPDFKNGHLNLGNTYAALGRFEEAVSVYKRAIAARPRSLNALINLGKIYEKMGKPGDALRTYEKALAIDPLAKTARLAVRNLKAQ